MSIHKPVRITPGPGQESVWDYPRPPRLERCVKRIRIVFNGVRIADSTRAWRVLETSHPPVYYIPPEDIRMDCLTRASGDSMCEWKGRAVYFSLEVDGTRAERVAWGYPSPTPDFAPITNHLAFYAGPMDACHVGADQVEPQPGGFYGGWVTSDIVGPFKGGPGTWGW